MDRKREQELVQASKNGDRLAIGTLVRNYERQVYNAALRMLGDPDDAADVTQTAFLKAFERVGQFNPRFKFFSWIYRITVNEAIDQLKRRARTEPLGDDPIAVRADPGDAVDASLMSDSVQAALMDLPIEQRAVLVLRYFIDCSYRQMAEILQVPEKTVKSRLFSARQRLKSQLEDKDFAR